SNVFLLRKLIICRKGIQELIQDLLAAAIKQSTYGQLILETYFTLRKALEQERARSQIITMNRMQELWMKITNAPMSRTSAADLQNAISVLQNFGNFCLI